MLNKLKWKNLNIGVKYGSALSVTLILFIISTGIVSILSTNVMSNIDLVDQRGERSIIVTNITSEFRSRDARIADYIHYQNQELVNEFEEKTQRIEEMMQEIQPRMNTEELQNLYKQLESNNQEVQTLFLEEMVPAVEQDDMQAVFNLSGRDKGNQKSNE